MRDRELVAAIVAGDPEGLAAAYDKYAASLYNYCRSLLHEPADAADVVQDTFVIAASRLGGLRDRDRLRPWLYAVARNECRRRIRTQTTSTLDEASNVTDETADVSGDAERAELRALLRAAVRGLNPAEQEVIELQLRQGLDGTEVADVLGISRNHAHALISRARDQLEISLGVLLVARTGREACAALNTLLEGWDGQLTALLRRRLHRHVERCLVCSERKRSALRPAMLLGLAPMIAIPATAAAPAGLRDEVLRLASSNGADAVAHRATLAARTTHFSPHGFPRPLDPPKHWWQARPAHIAAAATTAAAVTAVTSMMLGGHSPHNSQATGRGTVPGAISSSHSAAPGASGTSSSGAGGITGPTATGQPTPGGVLTSPSPGRPGPSSPGSSSPAPRSTSPGPPRPSTPPPPTTPAPTSVAPGTLTVAPTSVVLTALGGTAVTISAQGGPVSWSISEPASLIGKLSVSPSSGTLQAGQQTTVTVTVNGLVSVAGVLTVNPGGHVISVLLGVL